MEFYAFMKHFKKWPDQVLPVMEWGIKETRAAFTRYMMEYYPEKDTKLSLNDVDKWIIKLTDAQT